MKTHDIINDDLLSLAKRIIELREQAVFLFGNGDLREALSIYDDLIYIKETFFYREFIYCKMRYTVSIRR